MDLCKSNWFISNTI